MFPSDQGQFGGANLESHLRGLILNNESPNRPPNGAGQPQMPMAMHPGQRHEPSPAGPASHRFGQQPPASPTQMRRRPNQAQRRQQNSQMTIPIDGRPGYVPEPWLMQPPLGFQQPWVGTQPFPDVQRGPAGFGQNQLFIHGSVSNPPFPTIGGPIGPPVSAPFTPPRHRDRGVNEGSRSMPRFNNGHTPDNAARRSPSSPSIASQTPTRGHSHGVSQDDLASQSAYLEELLCSRVSTLEISVTELDEKEALRARLEEACQAAITRYETEELQNTSFRSETVQVKCFGSMASGFATKGSDMDLALLTPSSTTPVDSSTSAIPRILEKTLLDLGFGARLLTRTRVPIIKLCERPTKELRQNLLESRRVWESGFTGEEEDNHGDDDGPPAEIAEPPQNAEQLSNKSINTSDQTYRTRLSSIKQKPEQSLNEYFSAAKRMQKKLAGRDLNIGYADDITPEELVIVKDVSRAFVQGLSNPELKERLLSYKSLSVDPVEPSHVRSLNGIFNQIEGEKLAMAWGRRPLPEATEKQEAEAARVLQEWRDLQDVTLLDTAAYNKEIHLTLDKLRRISSLQLACLEQAPHEDPITYHSRASRILRDLSVDEHRPRMGPIAGTVLDHYVAGVSNPTIQEGLTAYSKLRPLLKDLSFLHRILHLACQYETALNGGLYEEKYRVHVEAYIALLRGAATSSTQRRNMARPIPLDRSNMELLLQIKELPDPTATHKREKYSDHLEFPKNGVGVQCDINFSAQLALHNTQLLRCYSHSDPRVRPMVLFVKHWAKIRGINTPYRGTLSSYGYVLMVLHYLVNVARPFVCPNLQELGRPPPAHLSIEEMTAMTQCNGCNIQFWKNEDAIKSLAARGLLNHNHAAIGTLLRGFFEYYAQNGHMSTGEGRGFEWGREVLSLRSRGGLLTKQGKGWVGARTVTETTTSSAPTPSKGRREHAAEGTPETPKVVEVKEIRHRYLFAIEDPFELDHNVARTVTHDGIVAIRDEFRRAWRIIRGVGKASRVKEGLLDEPAVKGPQKTSLQELMDLIHGPASDVTELAE